MKRLRMSVVFTLALAAFPSTAAEKAPRTPAQVQDATRLQVFLDRKGFSPGKIDGYFGDFTRKALAFYRQSRGESRVAEPALPPGTLPDLSGLGVEKLMPVFVTYTVTEADLAAVGPMAKTVKDQARQPSMPYENAAEAVAEKFHCDLKFLREMNPGKTATLKAGDRLLVPNVEPFELAAVAAIVPGHAVVPRAMPVNDPGVPWDPTQLEEMIREEAKAPVRLRIDVKKNMLLLYERDRLTGVYPVTVGSAQTRSPLGDWKVKGVAKMPDFRYDESVLKEGVRSSDYHILRPGPNNPVGVVWIALNKPGVGIHGTNSPDTIGRAVSHGCVRMANWDVARLIRKVKSGVPVAIH